MRFISVRVVGRNICTLSLINKKPLLHCAWTLQGRLLVKKIVNARRMPDPDKPGVTGRLTFFDIKTRDEKSGG